MSKIWVPRLPALHRQFQPTPRWNWWATGTGTTSGHEWFVQMRMFGEANRLLVISTKRICTMVASSH